MTADIALRLTLAVCGAVLAVTVAVLRTVPRRRLGPVLSGVLTAAAAVLLLYGAVGANATGHVLAAIVGVVLAVLMLAWITPHTPEEEQ